MRNKKLFLGILNHFLHREYPLPDMSNLEEKDWKEIFAFASIHAVFPVVYEAAWRQKSFDKLPAELRESCRRRMKRQVVAQAQSTGFFLMCYQGMIEEGLMPLVVKGLICRNMYEQPDFRISADEDLLIRREEYGRLDAYLKKTGFVKSEGGESENLSLEEIHEITYTHKRTGLRLEVHLSLFPEQSKAYGRLNEEFPGIFEQRVSETVLGIEVYTLNETQHMLYLLCHGLKHFLHSGFGIRQLCDMVLFAETYGDRIDWEEIRERTKRQKMYRFWMNLFDIGERYLGFSWEKADLERPNRVMLDSEEMLADILDSGIYGKSSQERLHSANVTLQAADGSSEERFDIRVALFPELEYMKRQYTYLEKRKWLLPVAWLERMVSYWRRMGERM